MKTTLVHYSATENERKSTVTMIKFDVVRRNLAFIVEKLHSFDFQAPSVVFDAALRSWLTRSNHCSACVLKSLFIIAVACELFYLGLFLSRTVTSTVKKQRRLVQLMKSV